MGTYLINFVLVMVAFVVGGLAGGALAILLVRFLRWLDTYHHDE